jgi:hypothetical protein
MARQYPLENGHFRTPYPQSGLMTRAGRDWWFSHVMDCAYLPAAGPKADTPRLEPPASPQRPFGGAEDESEGVGVDRQPRSRSARGRVGTPLEQALNPATGVDGR